MPQEGGGEVPCSICGSFYVSHAPAPSSPRSLPCSTTVVEVGVDVPQATVMVVEHAREWRGAHTHWVASGAGQALSTTHATAMSASLSLLLCGRICKPTLCTSGPHAAPLTPYALPAERFGFAQLHQLRGRVGRSSRQSYCYLVYDGGDGVQQKMKVGGQGSGLSTLRRGQTSVANFAQL